jgi:hypothetical protein
MLVLGLAGQPKVGKNEVAEYLVNRYGFTRATFSDALYHEVQMAFRLETQNILRDPATKDVPQDRMMLKWCSDKAFIAVATGVLDNLSIETGAAKLLVPTNVPLKPREILQWWGTNYRRAQDPDYWVKKFGTYLYRYHMAQRYPEHRPALFVADGVRFENERKYIHDLNGNIWHIYRDYAPPDTTGHIAEAGLEVLENERELWNNDTIERLHMGIDLMLSNAVPFVKIEPMED